jgi:YesN/AraC family two-component response regulator
MSPFVVYIAASDSHRASEISWHEHEHHEIVLLLRGSSAWEFDTGETLRLSGDEYKIVPPYQRHRGLQDIRNPSSVCVIGFRVKAAAKGRSLFTPKEAEWLEQRFHLAGLTVSSMTHELRRAAKALHRAIQNHAKAQRLEAPVAAATLRLLVTNVLLEVASQAQTPADEDAQQTVARAIACMEEHFAQPLSMNQVCERIACNRTHLFRAFKQHEGMPPNDWLQRFRIRKAQHLLQTSNRTLEDIAHSTGFATSAYFCTVFRKYTGLTPGQYRTTPQPRGVATPSSPDPR